LPRLAGRIAASIIAVPREQAAPEFIGPFIDVVFAALTGWRRGEKHHRCVDASPPPGTAQVEAALQPNRHATSTGLKKREASICVENAPIAQTSGPETRLVARRRDISVAAAG
jgi:hypothetical protein